MITTYETKSAVSKAIKTLLEEMLYNATAEGSVCIKDFDNCREQGYVFELTRIKDDYLFSKSIFYAFAEHRNSDNIVVYKGKGIYDLDTVSDDFWNSAVTFNPDKIMEAVNFIFSGLIDEIEKHTKEN